MASGKRWGDWVGVPLWSPHPDRYFDHLLALWPFRKVVVLRVAWCACRKWWVTIRLAPKARDMLVSWLADLDIYGFLGQLHVHTALRFVSCMCVRWPRLHKEESGRSMRAG